MKTKILYALLTLMFVTVACSTQAFPAPEPTAAPTLAPQPTDTPIPPPTPWTQPLRLVSVPFEESKDGPVYKITAQIPTLTESKDPRVAAFNARVNEIVKTQVDAFRSDILANQPLKPFVAGSSFDVQYELVAQRGDIWSFKFSIMSFLDGAAHPNHYSVTLNYDLAQARELALDDLFLHGVGYLQTISDYCKAELSKRDIGFTDPIFQSGADPTPENYHNWNLSDDGLVITFDPYQVAPYAAGSQLVTIPFDKLLPLASPDSALKAFSQK